MYRALRTEYTHRSSVSPCPSQFLQLGKLALELLLRYLRIITAIQSEYIPLIKLKKAPISDWSQLCSILQLNKSANFIGRELKNTANKLSPDWSK
eukprot:Seg1773.6 transcript_id=Seg1773.6/GoldUCD/mRNA.D3Y31 product="hypothetical protein" protein_id=Seg1773.6/GoldUCD/D3Y31